MEMIHRWGRARICRFHTLHGRVRTPALLPVVNPNRRTVEPAKMWDLGYEMLITNAYIILQSDVASAHARAHGVHDLLEYPGAIMTDSGTFQSYVYGDVDLDPEEIVRFQQAIGVDVGTMLDVFGTPSMTYEEHANAVQTTLERAVTSLDAAEGLMLNGPIQGGSHPDLRRRSAEGMASLGFNVHPIGGIVPLMEQRRWRSLARIMLSTIPHLPPDRPVHLFGCGHPMLFPMCTALGADLFDSAAYVLFARDDRLLTPEGTVRLKEIEHWPATTEVVNGRTVAEVRALPKADRERLLSLVNLEWTMAELERCRQAVRDGTIWDMARRRSHVHPDLRSAWRFVEDLVAGRVDEPGWEVARRWLLDAQPRRGQGGQRWWGEDSTVDPLIVSARSDLVRRWTPAVPYEGVIVIEDQTPPWRDRWSERVHAAASNGHAIVVDTPLGWLPWSLEDLNPFAHLEGAVEAAEDRLTLETRRRLDADAGDAWKALRNAEVIDRWTKVDASAQGPPPRPEADLAIRWVSERASVVLGLPAARWYEALRGGSLVWSRTGRVRNVLDAEGRHVLSPRYDDGGLSLTAEGARLALRLLEAEASPDDAPSVARVWIPTDAVPFVGKGRNVIHGFIEGTDPWLAPGHAVLVLDPSGGLVAHGISCCTWIEAERLRKGIAVRIRDGMIERRTD